MAASDDANSENLTTVTRILMSLRLNWTTVSGPIAITVDHADKFLKTVVRKIRTNNTLELMA